MTTTATYNKSAWLGNYPAHWQVLRIKNIFSEIEDRSTSGNEELLSVSHYTGITLKRDSLENEDDFISNAETLEGYKRVAKGDLVINIMLAWNGSLGISPFDGITSPAYCVYRAKENNNPEYFGYLFASNLLKTEFRKKSTGIIDSRLRLYSDKFFSIFSVVPPVEEQNKIVEYIKTQSQKINHFIAKKQQFIALLKEQRQSVITKAITKGVNDKASFKPSNIEWLGDIPTHWKLLKLKYVGESFIGLTYSPSEIVDEGEGTLVLRSSNIQNGKYTLDDNVFVNKEISDKLTTKIGDILLCSRNGSADLIGKNNHLIGWITQNRIDDILEKDTVYISRDYMGYATKYHRASANGAKYIWNIWWAQRDDKGYVIGESGTDNIQYLTMKEAKEALQNKFSISEENVKSLDNSWNSTQYI
ncbi:MAG: restriction endonuclease subunit S [Alphaproteobacteria bacterium]|nr:restriction endonuclease subunit S [Alphaproteobacteria bacterium]